MRKHKHSIFLGDFAHELVVQTAEAAGLSVSETVEKMVIADLVWHEVYKKKTGATGMYEFMPDAPVDGEFLREWIARALSAEFWDLVRICMIEDKRKEPGLALAKGAQ